jgi:tetratricopeptide (TPR) repeat protein
VTKDRDLASRLLDVARQVDPDPWRDQVRDVKTWEDLPRLKQLAKDVIPQQQTPQIQLLLAQRLRVQGGQKEAADLLRAALLHHPADFWLNINLSELVADLGEKTGCFRAALAIRPSSAPVLGNLGATLYNQQDLDGAIACYKKALEIDPKYALAHNNLGAALNGKKDLDGAMACYKKALEFDPKLAAAHANMGIVLYARKDVKAALACFKKALELDATSAITPYNVGRILYDKNDLDGAITCYQQALANDPKFAPAHYNLGVVLAAKKNLNGAITCYKKTLELDPKHVLAHLGLGNALNQKQDLDGAIACFQKALDLDPKHVPAYNNLGNALKVKGDVAGAIACYKKAIALDPNLAEAHLNLGKTLMDDDQLSAALKELQIGHQVGSQQPGWPYPSGLWVKRCEQFVALDQKLTAIQQGQAQPGNAAEQLALAELCQMCKKRYFAAVQFYAGAFAAAPNLPISLTKAHRYDAACAAALAAAGLGKDAAKLDAPAKAKLRQQALTWLKADLEFWQGQATSGQPAAVQTVLKKLSHWQTDTDLVSVRDEKALALLPEAERKEWQSFWAEVEKLLKQAKK